MPGARSSRWPRTVETQRRPTGPSKSWRSCSWPCRATTRHVPRGTDRALDPMPDFQRGLPLPRNLAESARREGREVWLATLPASVARLSENWSLTVGAPYQPGGSTAWTAPARTTDGTPLVLKVGWRHPEALHEADGL